MEGQVGNRGGTVGWVVDGTGKAVVNRLGGVLEMDWVVKGDKRRVGREDEFKPGLDGSMGGGVWRGWSILVQEDSGSNWKNPGQSHGGGIRKRPQRSIRPPGPGVEAQGYARVSEVESEVRGHKEPNQTRFRTAFPVTFHLYALPLPAKRVPALHYHKSAFPYG